MMACSIVTNPNASAGTYTAPVADFLPVSGTVEQSDIVSFTDLSTLYPTAWSWTVNGSLFSIQQNPTLYFGTIGTFVIRLTATNSYGSSFKESTITVEGGGGGIPP